MEVMIFVVSLLLQEVEFYLLNCYFRGICQLPKPVKDSFTLAKPKLNRLFYNV